MSNNRFNNEDLIKGLAPAIEMQEVGKVFKETLQGLAAKVNESISRTFDLPELDNIILLPKIAHNAVGASDLKAIAYFSTVDGNGNIFYRGKGSNRRDGSGRIMIVEASNGSTGGTGKFGTSDHFRQIMKPFCKVNDNNGKAIFDIKSVPGHNNLASLELDANALISFALGVEPNDAYDFDIFSVVPIPNSKNYSIAIMKYINVDGVRKGRHNTVNYARLEQDQFRIFNGNGNNNRNY